MGAIRTDLVLVLTLATLLPACAAKKLYAQKDVVPDQSQCDPVSDNSAVRKESMRGCHVGIPGNGARIAMEMNYRSVSLDLHQAGKEMVSIFVPLDAIQKGGTDLHAQGFYSRGDEFLTGKTGCVGVADELKVSLSKQGGRRILSFDATFALHSPLGWKGECTDRPQKNGSLSF